MSGGGAHVWRVTNMTKKSMSVVREESSSGNVFADLGMPHPQQELLKARTVNCRPSSPRSPLASRQSQAGYGPGSAGVGLGAGLARDATDVARLSRAIPVTTPGEPAALRRSPARHQHLLGLQCRVRLPP